MNDHLPRSITVTVAVLASVAIIAATILFATDHSEGAWPLLSMVGILVGGGAATSRISHQVTATHDTIKEVANGRTEAIVRKVVGQEVAKLATAQQKGKPYTAPPEANTPPSPQTPSGGGEMPAPLDHDHQ